MNKCMISPFHMHSSKDADGFEQVLNDPSLSLMMLAPKSIPIKENDLVLSDLKRCKECGKYAVVGLGSMLTDKNDEPYHRPLRKDWKQLIDDVNDTLCAIGEEYFWGYMFFEPFSFMTEGEYVEVTKYMSSFGKRIAAVHSVHHIHQALWPIDESNSKRAVSFRNMSTINEENHKYTTDVSYNYLGEWDRGIHQTTVFKLFVEKLGNRFNDMNFWFTLPIGVFSKDWVEQPDSGEQVCLDVFMGMWNWAKKYNNFSGFFLYTFLGSTSWKRGWVYGNGKQYLMPDENGNIRWNRLRKLIEIASRGFADGRMPNEIELPDVAYDEYGITMVP